MELDSANCLAHYARASALRRVKANVFASPAMTMLTVNDPQVIAFSRTSDAGNRVFVCVLNFGADESWVSVEGAFAADGLHHTPYWSESDHTNSLSVPWTFTELKSSILKLLVPRFGSVTRIFKPALPSARFLGSLLNASLLRNGEYARSRILQAVESSDCRALAALLSEFPPTSRPSLAQLAKPLLTQTCALMAKLRKLGDAKHLHATDLLAEAQVGPILFTTPELGKWSTYGGLGVMVDDLTVTLAEITGEEIWVCSPYYERNRKGETGYLAKDGIEWTFNVEVDLGTERVTVGIFEKKIAPNFRLFFMHNAKYLPSIYPEFSPVMMTGFLVLMAKCPLEICCKLSQFPRTIVTNDWATGLTAAFGKNERFFGQPSVFQNSRFMHIVHNLDQNYEGRIFPHKHDDLGRVHQLPTDLLVDPHWNRPCVNPSRCAILSSDNWGTVSLSYRRELMEGSPLAPLLRMHASPFAHPNGIPLLARLGRLKGLGSHWEAKSALQKKYFPHSHKAECVLFGFVGRITFQKGIHLILDIAEQLLKRHAGNVQIMLCGASNPGESYSVHCAQRMVELTRRFPNNFWSDPNAFFTDGSLVNLGADFGLMPSAFEPGGIVQQEFMVAGTPVIAFKTGGLRDTISEFHNGAGNGFTFEAHTGGDLAYAIERAMKLFSADKPGYLRLRENAFKSVITCEMVARAWLMEFYRMHGKVFIDHAQVTALEGRLPEFVVEDLQPPVLEEFDSSESEGDDVLEEIQRHPSLNRETSLSQISRASSSPRLRQSASTSGIARKSIRIFYKPSLTSEKPRSVLLAGSFDQWASRIPLKWEQSTRSFFVDIRFPLGKWLVKLVVDGRWICAPDLPTEKGLDGHMNNVVLVD